MGPWGTWLVLHTLFSQPPPASHTTSTYFLVLASFMTLASALALFRSLRASASCSFLASIWVGKNVSFRNYKSPQKEKNSHIREDEAWMLSPPGRQAISLRGLTGSLVRAQRRCTGTAQCNCYWLITFFSDPSRSKADAQGKGPAGTGKVGANPSEISLALDTSEGYR